MSLTEADRETFSGLTCGQISDAMESLKLRRWVLTGFMMLTDPDTRNVGTAVTIRQVPKNASEAHEQRFTRHNEVTGKIVKPGVVVIPKALKEPVLNKAAEISRKEAEGNRVLKAGKALGD